MLFIRHLQRRFSNEVGFIPDEATRWYAANGQATIALENGAPAGMLLGRHSLRWCIALRPITQAAVDFDAQRRHIGLSLIERVAADAREAGQVALQACCREEIAANEFWRIAGFEEVCRLKPDNARRRAVICWRKQLRDDFRPTWFLMPPPVSGYRAAKSRTR